MILVQQFLKNNTFRDLEDCHGVFASFDKSGSFWSLNYDQILSKDNDLLAQQCRGIILSCPDGSSLNKLAMKIDDRLDYGNICPGETIILAAPLFRFFNEGQGAAASIDWNAPDLKMYEKMDGTLIIVWFNPFANEWNAATRRSPQADILMDNGVYTFKMLFEKILMETIGFSFTKYASKLNKEITYCFELCSKLNRIVVDYAINSITLIAARNTNTLKELEIEDLPSYGVPCVHAYPLMSINELVEWVSTLNPSEHEGVVVRDSQFNRIKVKNAAYVAFSKARDRLGHSERNCLEIILLGKEDDLIPYLPEEIIQNLLKIKSGLQEVIRYYDGFYQSAHLGAQAICPNDKKTFALIIKDKITWTAPFFQMWDGKCHDMRGFIEKNKANGTFSDSFLDKLLSLIK